jgi:hypothetical protein
VVAAFFVAKRGVKMEGQGWYLDVMGDWTEEEEEAVRGRMEGLVDPSTGSPWRFCKVSSSLFLAHRVTWDSSTFAGTLDEVFAKIARYYSVKDSVSSG